MTEQLKYRAKINSKGLDNTGVTEDHARSMASRLGSHHLFIVEGKAAKLVIDDDGNQQVAIVLTGVEPVPAEQEDTVREFMRALYRTRPEVQGQEVLKGTSDGPSVADAASALSAHVERNEDGEATGIWDGTTDGPLPDLPDDAYPEDAQEIPAADEPEGSDGLEGDTRPWPGDEDGAVQPVDFSARRKQK